MIDWCELMSAVIIWIFATVVIGIATTTILQKLWIRTRDFDPDVSEEVQERSMRK